MSAPKLGVAGVYTHGPFLYPNWGNEASSNVAPDSLAADLQNFMRTECDLTAGISSGTSLHMFTHVFSSAHIIQTPSKLPCLAQPPWMLVCSERSMLFHPGKV